MSYEQFYGLKEQPFSNAPDSRFFYESEQHAEAMVRIMHAVDTMKGLTVMMGDSGTGKTLLALKINDKLYEGDTYEASLLVIIHGEVTPDWFLKKIAAQFGIESPGDDKKTIITALFKRLLAIHEEGKKAVILVDEANMLQSKAIFEEMRGLLNMEVPGKKLLSIVLIGLPDLEKNLALDPPLAQRVASRFSLKYLTMPSTGAYIRHRMRIAEGKEDTFTEAALVEIFHYSKGIPRLINTICDNSLLEGYLTRKVQLDGNMIHTVAADLGLKKSD
jgi:type II secretory pathway predicted ATPase ExeA